MMTDRDLKERESISTIGDQVAWEGKVEVYRTRGIPPRVLLHPNIVENIWDDLSKSYKIIEVQRKREAKDLKIERYAEVLRKRKI